jgi:protocatechuate 3,4-dioxygenase beta subunit
MRKSIVMGALSAAILTALGLFFAWSTWSGEAPEPERAPGEGTSAAGAAADTARAPDGAVTGHVLRSDGAPIPGATVRAGGQAATTDDLGAFTLTGLPAGPHTVDAQAPGYVSPGPAEVRGRAIEAPGPGGPALEDLDLVLREPGVIRGRVLAAGVPVAGASVSLFYLHADAVKGSLEPFALDAVTTSAGDGTFDTGEVAPGRLRVLVEAPGHALAESKEFLLREGDAREGLTIDLAPSATLRVSVRDGEGAPLPGADVVVAGGALEAARKVRAGADGVALVSRLPPGEVVVTARAPSKRDARAEVTLEPQSTTEVALTLSPASGIFGRVVDANGEPVPGSFVWLRGDARRPQLVRASAEGAFQWDPPADQLGGWSIRAGSPRHALGEEVPAPAGRALELTVGGSGTISGQVVTSSGRPVQNFRVAIEDIEEMANPRPHGPRSIPAQPVSHPSGRFTFGPLRPGTYHVRVDPQDHGHAVAGPVVVRAGADAGGLRVVVRDAGVVTGTVTSQKTGEPLAGARVQLFDPGSSARPRSARADAQGRFRIEGASPGRRSLRVSSRGHMTQVASGVEVPEGGETARDVALEPAVEGARFAFHGIGATLARDDRGIVVRDLMEDSPAAVFGMKKGDVIVAVDRESVEDVRFGDVINRIRGEEGVPVSIEVMREGEGRITLEVERGRVVVRGRNARRRPRQN